MFTVKESYDFQDFRELVELLRSPDGCPWDREQTHESIRKNFIEETYEAVDAIDKKDTDLLREELGDVLLQVMLHARMEEEEGTFSISDVIDEVCKKLVLRHPHVFRQTQVDGTQQVLENWDAIKRESKGQKTHAQSVQDVPATLPALMRGQKVQKRAAKSGLLLEDFSDSSERLQNYVQMLTQGDAQQAEEIMGKILLCLLEFCRFFKVDAEECLTKATNTFINRFVTVEGMTLAQGRSASGLSDEEKKSLWACTD